MFQAIIRALQVTLASINIAGIVNTLFKLHQRNINAANNNLAKRNKRNKPENCFNSINPYLQTVAFSYSAYRLLNSQNDPIAYLGTGIATVQIYQEYKAHKLKSK